MWRYNHTYPYELYHYGIKDMKWGVRRTPEQLGHNKKKIVKNPKSDIIKIKIYGHKSTPKKSTPNSVIDHISDEGKVRSRSFYDDDGLKEREIHTTNHGNAKHHNFGKNGEHMHEYQWDEECELKNKISRELTHLERKENEDIL